MRKHTSARAGFTLIEVMIALAIFVVGAVAIVRIFPPALAAIQKSQDRTNASRLASSQVERFSPRGNLSSVPDAIYNGDSTGAYVDTFAGAFNGTVNRNESLPRDVRATNLTALDAGRFIDGERQRVMQDGTGKLFILTNFPYSSIANLTSYPFSPIAVSVSREDTIDGVRLRANGSDYVFDFSGATYASTGNSAAHTGTGTDTWYPSVENTDRSARYYISYKWLEGGRIHGVIDEPYVIVYDSTNINSLKPVRNGVTGITPIVGEVNVRVVQAISTTSTPTVEDGLRGVYVFTGGVSAGDTVRISYRVAFDAGDDTLGWRGLIVDQAPAANAVTLTTRGLDQELYGDTLYALAYSAPNANGISAGTPLTGDCTPGKDGACGATSGVLENVKDSGNETNRVGFKAASLATLTAPRARIMYRPEDGWGVQASVAARSYVPYLAPTAVTYLYDPASTTSFGYVRQPWREYLWSAGAGSDIIYFQPSEAGKTVLVSYEYLEGSVYRTVRDAIVTLSDEISNTPVAAFGSGSGPTKKVARAEIIDPNGNIPTITAILAVRGLSVQARTVWADNTGRYSQAVVTDYRKRS